MSESHPVGAPVPQQFFRPVLRLYVDDLQRAATFYSALGYRQVSRAPATGEISRLRMAMEERLLELVAARIADPQRDESACSMELVLESPDVPAARDFLLAIGATAASNPVPDAEGNLTAQVRDRDGHRIRLVAFTKD